MAQQIQYIHFISDQITNVAWNSHFIEIKTYKMDAKIHENKHVPLKVLAFKIFQHINWSILMTAFRIDYFTFYISSAN